MPDNASASLIRGQTFYGPTATIPTAGESASQEGFEKTFADYNPTVTNGAKALRSGASVYCRLVRNSSGINLLPKRVVKYKSTYYKKRVDGYCTLDFDNCAGVVDEHLPTAGVRDGDLFWITYRGPTLVLTNLAGDGTNLHVQGVPIVALTAATSQATTAGRVQTYFVTSGATVIGSQALQRIGIAMSAKTTANTNADLLADIFLA